MVVETSHTHHASRSLNRVAVRGVALMLGLSVLLVLGACTSDAPGASETIETITTGETATDDTAAPELAVDNTPVVETAEQPTAVVNDATPTLAPEIPPVASCAEVPTFSAADTVSVACAGDFAVSPELFASNAGWHLFSDNDGQWLEIDYARTCCEDGDPSFTDLLVRNGLDATIVADMCTQSGLDDDAFSGCDAPAGEESDESAFEGSWLRVDGLGPHDFGTSADVVMSMIEETFGAPNQISEQSECGAGPMTSASFTDFSVQMQNDAFVGWFYTSSTPALTTPSGVTPGITETSLIQVYDGVEISTDTLGKEFTFQVPSGFIGGFFDDTGSTVTHLYAGVTCFFR